VESECGMHRMRQMSRTCGGRGESGVDRGETGVNGGEDWCEPGEAGANTGETGGVVWAAVWSVRAV
jgi:hypothetical protein